MPEDINHVYFCIVLFATILLVSILSLSDISVLLLAKRGQIPWFEGNIEAMRSGTSRRNKIKEKLRPRS